jgi:hypothetical protein
MDGWISEGGVQKDSSSGSQYGPNVQPWKGGLDKRILDGNVNKEGDNVCEQTTVV